MMDAKPRKRLKRYEVPGGPRFLTFSCYQRLPLFSNDAIKDAFVEHLAVVRRDLQFRLGAWVIMPEHVHLIVVPEFSLMPRLLRGLKGQFACDVIDRWKELGAPILGRIRGADNSFHFWQAGGGYDRNVRDECELSEKIEYIHNNPVTRGLVESPTDYQWSSARWYGDAREGQLTIDPIA